MPLLPRTDSRPHSPLYQYYTPHVLSAECSADPLSEKIEVTTAEM